MKRLGVTFCEGLMEANEINWNKTKENMENHTRKLSYRNLSSHGKGILLNTLLMAKITYVSNLSKTTRMNRCMP